MFREFVVDDVNVGARLDKFLAGQMPEYSRSEIQRFNVFRSGNSVKFSEKVPSCMESGIECLCVCY